MVRARVLRASNALTDARGGSIDRIDEPRKRKREKKRAARKAERVAKETSGEGDTTQTRKMRKKNREEGGERRSTGLEGWTNSGRLNIEARRGEMTRGWREARRRGKGAGGEAKMKIGDAAAFSLHSSLG